MSIFNIRVYGLLFRNKSKVLVTDEFRFGHAMTKFPGGGLHWGEGTLDCLRREFREELDCEIEIIRHVYTTDFFQPSAFHKDHQIISIYYAVKEKTPIDHRIIPGISLPKEEGAQIFHWIDLTELPEKRLTFPIDQHVARLISGIRF